MQELNYMLLINAVNQLCKYSSDKNARLSSVVYSYINLSDDDLDNNLASEQIADHFINNLHLKILKSEVKQIKQKNQKLIQNIDASQNSIPICQNIIDNFNNLKVLLKDNIFYDQIMSADDKPLLFEDLLKAVVDPYSV